MILSTILNVKKSQVIKSSLIINELKKKKTEKIVLNSGSNNLDKVLGGGFYSGKKYLIFGANMTGKTQLCHQICVQAFKHFSSEEGGKKVKLSIYLDTENTFRPERIREIAIANNLDDKKVLESILVGKIMSNSTLLFSLNEAEVKIKEDNNPLLVIDSLNNHFRSELGDKNFSFYKTKTTFLKILTKLDEITKKFNLITIGTAQIAPNFVDEAIIKELPVGHQYLNHFFTEQVYLDYKGEKKGYAQLVNSSQFPEKKLLYKITTEGIKDLKI